MQDFPRVLRPQVGEGEEKRKMGICRGDLGLVSCPGSHSWQRAVGAGNLREFSLLLAVPSSW